MTFLRIGAAVAAALILATSVFADGGHFREEERGMHRFEGRDYAPHHRYYREYESRRIALPSWGTRVYISGPAGIYVSYPMYEERRVYSPGCAEERYARWPMR